MSLHNRPSAPAPPPAGPSWPAGPHGAHAAGPDDGASVGPRGHGPSTGAPGAGTPPGGTAAAGPVTAGAPAGGPAAAGSTGAGATAAGVRGRTGRLRGYLGRMSLATRLVAAAMALVLVALLLIGGASVMFMRNYLQGRVDSQLHSMDEQVQEQIATNGTNSYGKTNIYLNKILPISTDSPVQPSWVFAFQLRGPDGKIDQEYEYPGLTGRPDITNSAAELNTRASQDAFTVDSTAGTDQWRVLVHKFPNSGQYLVIAASFRDVDSTIDRLIRIELGVGLAVLALLAVVGAAVVSVSLRPLRDIERTAGAIAAGNLGLRVPERDPRTELGRLGRALNVMLGQIEQGFAAQAASEHAARRSADSARRAADAAGASASAAHHSEEKMRRFVADASHELRTPLTTIRGFAELYRQRADADPAEAERLMARIEAEAARMGLLVEDLLMLARLDQQRPVAREPVDLLAVAADTAQNARAVDVDRDITLRVGGDSHGDDTESAGAEGSDAPPVVAGDEPRLRQVVRNLVDNAMAHTPPGTPVEIRVRTERDSAVVEVADQGPGLTHQQRERVFERFYRVDKARSREAGGTGLGLAIVASLVGAHHGTVEVDSEPGRGATFRVRLPLADDAPSPPHPDATRT